MKVRLFLFGSFINQSITSAVFCHWLNLAIKRISLLILFTTCWLTIPISPFAGFIKRHVVLVSKWDLWSFNVIKGLRSANTSTRSAMSNFLAITLPSKSMSFICCDLCLSEKTIIAMAERSSLSNRRAEMVSTCRHRTKFHYHMVKKKRPVQALNP